MDFRQLEAFVSTVEHKSFSAAAAALYLSQPTISSHVHSLEKELCERRPKECSSWVDREMWWS